MGQNLLQWWHAVKMVEGEKKGFTAEQVIARLREAAILLGQGEHGGRSGRKLGITEQPYYR